jgi:hypothetical protein
MSQCAECRFFWRTRDAGGMCRRFPPQLVVEPYNPHDQIRGQVTQHFPYMENTEWCGEFNINPATDDSPF